MIILRDYQQRLVDEARQSFKENIKSVLLCAPTGAGKTVMFSYIAQAAQAKGKKILILAHRTELIDQISETLEKFGVTHDFVIAKKQYDPSFNIHIGSVLTVINRLRVMNKPDLIILDEAHHAALNNSWNRILSHYDCFKLGVTATPCRLDGKGLNATFDKLIIGPTTAELIEQKHLIPFKYYGPPNEINFKKFKTVAGDWSANESMFEEISKPSIVGDVLLHYEKYLMNKKAVVFCINIEHAQIMAETFNRYGVSSACLHSKLKHDEREEIINNFKSGKILVLTNVNIVSEGFDLPDMDGVILLRPTKSLSLYLQQIGRALRKATGKTQAIILDHVSNYKHHGLPDMDREWSLDGVDKKKSKQEAELSIKHCKHCYAVNSSSDTHCFACGKPLISEEQELPETKDGQLEEIESYRLPESKVEKEKEVDA